jgi:hypothetical protein
LVGWLIDQLMDILINLFFNREDKLELVTDLRDELDETKAELAKLKMEVRKICHVVGVILLLFYVVNYQNKLRM